MYRSELWRLNASKRKKIVFVMKGHRAVCGISRRDRVRSVRIKEMCGWRRNLLGRAKQNMMKWFGHVYRRNEERMVKKMTISEMEGARDKRRPRRGWMNGVKGLLRDIWMTWEEGVRLSNDRNEWKRLVWGDRGN